MRVNCSNCDVRLRERERAIETKGKKERERARERERERERERGGGREREREGGREGEREREREGGRERERYNTLCGSLANTDIGLPGVHSSFTLVSLVTDTFSTHNSLNYEKKSSHVTVHECNHTCMHLIIVTLSHDQVYLERSCEVVETPL